jgi:hypothetical protein
MVRKYTFTKTVLKYIKDIKTVVFFGNVHDQNEHTFKNNINILYKGWRN